MEATILTKRNAHRAAVVRQIANPEYEASLWYGAHRGEPSSIRALLDDMDWYDSKLKELSDKLDEYEN